MPATSICLRDVDMPRPFVTVAGSVDCIEVLSQYLPISMKWEFDMQANTADDVMPMYPIATGGGQTRTDWLHAKLRLGGWLVGLGKLIAIYVPWHFCVWPSDWCRERSVCCRYLCFFRKMQIVHPNDGNLIRSLIGHSTPRAINTRQLA